MASPTFGAILNSATASSAMQTSAMTDKIMADEAHGSHIPLDDPGVAGPTGMRWNIYHGTGTATTPTAPVTTMAPSFKISRLSKILGQDYTTGASVNNTAFEAVHESTVDSTGQVTAISASASTISTVHPTGNADVATIFAKAYNGGSSNGNAAPVHLVSVTRSPVGGIRGMEIMCRNQSALGVGPAWDGSYNVSGLSSVVGIWLTLNDRQGGVGFQFGNPANFKWTEAIAFCNQNGGPASNACIRDDSTGGNYSLLIGGANAIAAIALSSTAGRLLVGMTTSGLASKAVIQTTAVGDAALCVQGMASQTAAVLQALNSAGTTKFSVFDSGNVVVTGLLQCDFNISCPAAAGTKIGTTTSQKIGFWNTTPAIQPTAVADASGGATVDTEGRAALNALLSRLRTIGIIAT